MTITTDPLERVDEIRLLEDELPTTEDVWVLWLRTPDGTYNSLSAGPTREECMAVLDKLLLGAAPGEPLRCLPKTVLNRSQNGSGRSPGSPVTRIPSEPG
jgi:hypothetical protein